MHLEGKIFFCLLGNTSAVIKDGCLQMIGGRLFLVGANFSERYPAFVNQTHGIAVDQVREFYLFDTIEEFTAAYNEWYGEQNKKGKSWFSWR